jgi:type II secretory pathway component PulM
MVIVTNSWKMWLAGVGVSLAIFAVLYFTVIQPDNNTANQALKSGLQQSQQAINQAQKQLSTAGGQASGASGQAQQNLNKAAKLTACVSAAGTDVSKLQACQAQYGH